MSEAEDYDKEFGIGEAESLARRPRRIRLWVTREDPPADLPTRASLATEVLEATDGSLRLLVPSRAQYEALYGLLAIFVGSAFLALWLLGALPVSSPFHQTLAPGSSSGLVLLVFVFVLLWSFALGSWWIRSRMYRHPVRTSVVRVLEFLRRYRGRVFLRVTDGGDAFWLCISAQPGGTGDQAVAKAVLQALSLANQTDFKQDE